MRTIIRATPLLLALPFAAAGHLLGKRASGVTTDASLAANQAFDYIVGGGGLTGLTVAARLAENYAWTILVIEAGADDRQDPRVYDPYRYGDAFNTELDWSWSTDQGRGIRGCAVQFGHEVFSPSLMMRASAGRRWAEGPQSTEWHGRAGWLRSMMRGVRSSTAPTRACSGTGQTSLHTCAK